MLGVNKSIKLGNEVRKFEIHPCLEPKESLKIKIIKPKLLNNDANQNEHVVNENYQANVSNYGTSMGFMDSSFKSSNFSEQYLDSNISYNYAKPAYVSLVSFDLTKEKYNL
jgi:hypothetical protein